MDVVGGAGGAAVRRGARASTVRNEEAVETAQVKSLSLDENGKDGEE